MTAWLVVNADDLGVSRGATEGIVRAHREGIVTSASLAPTMPGYLHALETCVRACPDLGVGLHFTLTAGRPVSPVRDVPDLVDAEGRLRWRFTPLMMGALLRSPSGLLDQVETEADAQLSRLASDGVAVDHVDGERHVHLIPGVFERVAAAAVRHGVPFVRLGTESGQSHLRAGHLPWMLRTGGFVKSALLSAMTLVDRPALPGGLRSTDRFVSYLYSGRLDLVLQDLLASPPVRGITEVMVHPGVPVDGSGADSCNAELERYLTSPDRTLELDACVAAKGSTGGWTLTTFGRLAREGASA